MGYNTEKYEAVIGLEVHAQLLTKSKAYSSDINEYGELPNTNVSPITLAHPGTLPRFNEQLLNHAILLGLACKSKIREVNEFARKNYFYADMPKGYQITQDTTPICTGGGIDIKDADGNPKTIGLTRIHMEEDSGKSIHDQDPFNTLIDLNRAGIPLLEIVSEPEIRSGEEAYNYVTEVRKIVRYLDICDGNMEEGSLRCDANISVRLRGAPEFGTKVEVKNMNSIRNVQRAIEFEINRQIAAIEAGEEIFHETRSFDALAGTTFSMRSKEMANDYRYFPEPDLLPVVVHQKHIEFVRAGMPKLPAELFAEFTTKLGLSEYDARILTDSKPIALYFEEMLKHTNNAKAAANWLMGEVKGYLNERGLHISDFPVSSATMGALIKLVDDGLVSNTVASQKVYPLLLENPKLTPLEIAQKNNWIQESDSDALGEFVNQALAKFPEKVQEYKNGKTGLIGLFMGEVMKLSKGKADPKVASQLIKEKLES
ncbi:MAG: Asp-tRNA(Asn)/Glu-tRNA(Gln) amidotransferase subunit GatB [Flavobacteriales bacterium]|nr:Asp-tRNA(Asn)/Glu-tRNA(Gln) amidotransferase subunit GatB [Flavobacteriales bacterium]